MAERLRDVVKFGSIDDIANTLIQQQALLSTAADTLWCMKEPRKKACVVSNICRATCRQLRILQLNLTNPIEAIASACRTIFELNLVLRWVSLSDDDLDGFIGRAATNEIDLLRAFLTLSPDREQAQQSALNTINRRITELEQLLERHDYKDIKRHDPKIKDMAQVIGCEDEYKAFYGLYCKYVHASSWLVNADEERRDSGQFRNIFLTKAQLYAGDTCARADQLAKGQ